MGYPPADDVCKGSVQLLLQFQGIHHVEVSVRDAITVFIPFRICIRLIVPIEIVEASPFGSIPEGILQEGSRNVASRCERPCGC